jgi:hypothetical protein
MMGGAQPSAAIGRFMSPPAPGLLSLGTPLASVASSNNAGGNAVQMTSTMVNGPTTNLATKSDGQQTHKIYELQQLAANIAAANHQEQQASLAQF